jgi:hypothetical protein
MDQTLSCMRLSAQTRKSPKKVGRPAASAARALRESNQFQSNMRGTTPPPAAPNVKPASAVRRVSSVGVPSSASRLSASASAATLKRASTAPSPGPAAKKGPAAPAGLGDESPAEIDEDVLAELAASREDNERLTSEVERISAARTSWEARAAEQAAQLARLQQDIEEAKAELLPPEWAERQTLRPRRASAGAHASLFSPM